MFGWLQTPGFVGRDGVTVFPTVEAFAAKWQVNPAIDGSLFRQESDVPFPQSCYSHLEETQERRRLGQDAAFRRLSQTACAGASPALMESCLDDVMYTGNAAYAEIYTINHHPNQVNSTPLKKKRQVSVVNEKT